MSLSKVSFLLIIFTLATIFGCSYNSSSSNDFELNVSGENLYTFDNQTINNKLKNLTTNCQDNCFVILTLADEKYLQTYYDPNSRKFTLEYRDGDETKHFVEATSLLTLTDIQKTFSNYYNKQNNWDKGISWEKLEM